MSAHERPHLQEEEVHEVGRHVRGVAVEGEEAVVVPQRVRLHHLVDWWVGGWLSIDINGGGGGGHGRSGGVICSQSVSQSVSRIPISESERQAPTSKACRTGALSANDKDATTGPPFPVLLPPLPPLSAPPAIVVRSSSRTRRRPKGSPTYRAWSRR